MRVPRTRGLTNLGHDLQEKQRHTIKMWALSDYKVLGTRVNSEDLANQLRVTGDEIANYVIEAISVSGMNLTIDHNLLGGLAKSLFWGILETKSLAIQNTKMLLAQQGSEYVPFLSQTALNSLKLVADVDMNLLAVIKHLQPTPGIVINQQINQETSVGVSRDDVLEILQNQLPHPNVDSPAILALHEKHDLGSIEPVTVGYAQEFEFNNSLNTFKERGTSKRMARIQARNAETFPNLLEPNPENQVQNEAIEISIPESPEPLNQNNPVRKRSKIYMR